MDQSPRAESIFAGPPSTNEEAAVAGGRGERNVFRWRVKKKGRKEGRKKGKM